MTACVPAEIRMHRLKFIVVLLSLPPNQNVSFIILCSLLFTSHPTTGCSIYSFFIHSFINSCMQLSSSWEAASHAATQELRNILWNPKVHYLVQKALHWFLSWARSIKSIPPHHSLRSISILFAHLCLGLHTSLFPSGFPIMFLHAFLFFPIRATCPAHLILLDHSNYIWRRVIHIVATLQSSTKEKRPRGR
jgi:hypothetical protein